jgi:hypothetical protein
LLVVGEALLHPTASTASDVRIANTNLIFTCNFSPFFVVSSFELREVQIFERADW